VKACPVSGAGLFASTEIKDRRCPRWSGVELPQSARFYFTDSFFFLSCHALRLILLMQPGVQPASLSS